MKKPLTNPGNDYETKPPHTPTPWHMEETTTNGIPDRTGIWLDDQNGDAVFNLPKLGNRTYEQMQIDAAFIVHAVNCHEELLEALKQLREDVIRHNQEYFQKQTDRHMVGVYAINKADQAIAKAEGKSI